MPFTLPPLPYPPAALEPHVDAATMEIHHGKHHNAYVTNANNALQGTPWADMDPLEVCRRISEVPDDKRAATRNNVGGHVNHDLFWRLLAPAGQGGGGAPTGALADAITKAFGSVDAFKAQFADAAMKRFGSGWAWLVSDGGTLRVVSTANQDNPYMGQAVAGCSGTPILGIDVWEHAYYLKHQNRRADYIAAWWNVVNWAEAARRFERA